MAYQLCGLFKTKAILVEEQQWYYLTYNWGGKWKNYKYVFTQPLCDE